MRPRLLSVPGFSYNSLVAPLRFSVVFALCVFSLSVFAQNASAQDSEDSGGVQKAQGVFGDRDSNGRSPVVSFQVVRRAATDGYSIIVDAVVPHDEYKTNPLIFDYYINRRFFTSQYRSQSLSGATGIDIGSDVAVPPFNVSVIVKSIAPNGRHFPTVAEIAVFSDNLLNTFNVCTLGREGEDYSAGLVSTSQLGNDTIELTFKGENSSGESAEVTAILTVSSSSASSTLDFIIDSVARTVTANGNVSRNDNEELIGLSIATSDGNTTLRCS